MKVGHTGSINLFGVFVFYKKKGTHGAGVGVKGGGTIPPLLGSGVGVPVGGNAVGGCGSSVVGSTTGVGSTVDDGTGT